MGGTLWVDTAEGRGSTFHFTIPLVSPASVPSPSQSNATAQSVQT
jgi:hypothetical protein